MKPRNLTVIALAAAIGLSSAAGAAAAAQSVPPNSAMMQAASSATASTGDASITTMVEAKLAATKGVDSADVTVKTMDGVVTLTGMLPSESAVHMAVAAAKSVKGVQDVDASALKSQQGE